MQDQVTVSPSASVTTSVSVAVSVVSATASVTAPVLSELAITGSSPAASTVTVAAIATVTESSPAPAVPPLSVIVVMVTTRFPAVGDWSTFLYAMPSINASINALVRPAAGVNVTVAVLLVTDTAQTRFWAL